MMTYSHVQQVHCTVPKY